jgi:hypothetical protein
MVTGNERKTARDARAGKAYRAPTLVKGPVLTAITARTNGSAVNIG